MKDDEFRCGLCKGIFEKEWTLDYETEPKASVCDDCLKVLGLDIIRSSIN